MRRLCTPGPWLRSRLAPFLLSTVVTILAGFQVALGAGDRVFSIPVDSLKLWSEKIIVPLDVRITGHSGVQCIREQYQAKMW